MIKKEYHHGNLKEEFLRIAFEFIVENDIEKLTLKVLSDATGTSRSAIYKHFKSRDALVEKMIEIGFEKFDLITSPVLLDKNVSFIDRFYRSGKLYIEFAKENPNLYRLLFGKKYAHIREEIVSIKDEDCSGFAALKIAIEDGQKMGILKKDSAFKQTIIIWSALHGLSSLIIDGFTDVDELLEEIYEGLFGTLLAGIIVTQVDNS